MLIVIIHQDILGLYLTYLGGWAKVLSANDTEPVNSRLREVFRYFPTDK